MKFLEFKLINKMILHFSFLFIGIFREFESNLNYRIIIVTNIKYEIFKKYDTVNTFTKYY